jgi:hypothetical protein
MNRVSLDLIYLVLDYVDRRHLATALSASDCMYGYIDLLSREDRMELDIWQATSYQARFDQYERYLTIDGRWSTWLQAVKMDMLRPPIVSRCLRSIKCVHIPWQALGRNDVPYEEISQIGQIVAMSAGALQYVDSVRRLNSVCTLKIFPSLDAPICPGALETYKEIHGDDDSVIDLLAMNACIADESRLEELRHHLARDHTVIDMPVCYMSPAIIEATNYMRLTDWLGPTTLSQAQLTALGRNSEINTTHSPF